MRTSPHIGGRNQRDWEPWNENLLTILDRGGTVETEPAAWLAAHQARRLAALLDALVRYQALAGAAPSLADAARARRFQGRAIAARLADLLKVGIRVRWSWRADVGAVLLLCQRSHR